MYDASFVLAHFPGGRLGPVKVASPSIPGHCESGFYGADCRPVKRPRRLSQMMYELTLSCLWFGVANYAKTRILSPLSGFVLMAVSISNTSFIT